MTEGHTVLILMAVGLLYVASSSIMVKCLVDRTYSIRCALQWLSTVVLVCCRSTDAGAAMTRHGCGVSRVAARMYVWKSNDSHPVAWSCCECVRILSSTVWLLPFSVFKPVSAVARGKPGEEVGHVHAHWIQGQHAQVKNFGVQPSVQLFKAQLFTSHRQICT